MAQSRPFLGRLEPFYGWYKRVSRQCSEPQNRQTKPTNNRNKNRKFAT